MVFPGQVVEIFVNGVWTNITPWVLTREPITITRGRGDWAAQAERGTCSFLLDDSDGRFSPRNPVGPYYGQLGRNTRVRVRVGSDVRFVGEIPAWPKRWDPTGDDRTVSVEAAGILRRLGTGARPLRSALFRAMIGLPRFAAWWPLEDGAGSRIAGTPYADQAPLRATGEVEFTAQPAGGTGGGAQFGSTGKLLGAVEGCPADWLVCAWFDVPADMPEGSTTPVLQWTTPGNAAATYWSVHAEQGAGARFVLEVANSDSVITRTLNVTIDARGRGPYRVMVMASNFNGTHTDTGLSVGSGSGSTSPADETVSSTMSVGPPAPIVQVGINRSVASGLEYSGTVSHVIVSRELSKWDIWDTYQAGSGYAGETAGDRVARLCVEEGIPLQLQGDTADTVPMGPQLPDTLLTLLAECAEADGGLLGEQRAEVGLRYRTRASQYNTSPDVTLTYGQTAPPLEQTDDDQHVRNDVTVSREGGSSARVVRTDGPLSVSAPPDGVGPYAEEVTLNLADDSTLADQAGWRVHLGTWDEPRYPSLTLWLHKDPSLVSTVSSLDARSHIRITSTPAWVSTEDVHLLVSGYTEALAPYAWTLQVNAVPQGPWRVGLLDTSSRRLDTAGSRLAAAVTSTATTMSVATTSGPVWTTDPGEFPLDVLIGGERVTVTGVSGGASPQTFTVVRSANGVVKPHTVNTPVNVAEPFILSF